MISIKIINRNLIVEDNKKQIFDWKNRVFFNISLGFKVDEENQVYSFSDKNEFPSVLKDVIDYLKEENLEYETDKKVSDLISYINSQEKEFEEVNTDFNKTPINYSLSLKRPLKTYQILGLEHLLKIKHGANFSVPGSGKTTVVYAYYDFLKRANIIDKLLVVGPYSSFSPWEDESFECFGKKISIARLSGAKRQSIYLQADQYQVFLCHYQTIANDINDIITLCQNYKVLMVVDESHYIKRFDGGIWANALLTIAPYVKRRVILSGTPMPNGYADLWTQFTFLWPGKQLLGEKNVYKNRISDADQQEIIKNQIRRFFFRVKKTDLKLPEPVFNKKEYSLSPIQNQIYHALSVKFLSELNLQPEDKQKVRQWRKAKMVRLLQAASNPSLLKQFSEEFQIPPLSSDGTSLIKLIDRYSQYEIPAKIVSAIELIKKILSENKKVILWTSFIHNIKMLEKLFEGANYYSIYGAIPKDDNENEDFNREKSIHEFKSTKTPSVLLANPAACAESISLHKFCHDAIYLDRTFNCGQFIQSLDRIHRIGLEPNEIVNYHILIAKNTIDETIDRRLDEKQRTMINVLEDDIPIGSFEIENFTEDQRENEESIDFEETMKDVKKIIEEQNQK